MANEDEADLPYGENFHDEAEAAAWADAAGRKRPWRPMIFDQFVAAVHESKSTALRVLELGSGPGFLAEHVLDRCPSRTEFVQADFKSDAWPAAVGGPFDFVLSNQAIHELRHKRHAPRLYAQLRPLLAPGGQLVVCDHLPDSGPTPRHRVLYMTIDENLAVLAQAGFLDAEVVWSAHEMALYRAHV